MIYFELTYPVFLYGLILLGVVGLTYWWSLVDLSRFQQRLLLGVRVTIFVLLILTLAGLTLRYPVHSTYFVFLIDESRSIDADAKRFVNEFMENVKTSAGTIPYTTVAFAGTPKLSIENSKTDNIDWKNETDISSALKPAMALVPPDYLPHLVLLSDGNETKGNVLETVLANNVPVSTILLPSVDAPEVQLSEIRVPAQVSQGEPFYIDVVVQSNRKTEGKISVFRGDFKVIEEVQSLETGENIFRFRQTVEDQSQRKFTAIIESTDDTITENNTATGIVFAGGKPRILLLESEPDTVFDFAAALREQDIDIEIRPADGIPQTLDEWEQFEAVILSDIPVAAFSLQQMNLLRNYVRDLGGGLLMLGGGQSFGLGGYYNTSLEEILPVRCDFEKEKEKPSLAMCLVIDSSGSMENEKIELAKDAAKSVVELLTARDFVSVIAFDSKPQIIVPIQNVISPAAIGSAIGKINAAGGTNIYPAILEAFEQLNRTSAKLKHVILLTDGKSEPGDFETLVRRMVDARITFSTIGIGDADIDLLKRLSDIGQGRFYPCQDPLAIPQIFARETMTASKSAIKETPFVPVILMADDLLAEIAVETMPPLLGFVVTNSKPSSRFVLATESGEPLLVWWRYGLGISVSFTSDVKNRWAAEWLTWQEFSKFWSQVIRHSMRHPETRGSVIDLKENNGNIHLILDTADITDNYINKAIGTMTVISSNFPKQEIALEPTAPGRYEGIWTLPERNEFQLQIMLQNNEKVLVSKSYGVTAGYPNELHIKPVNTELLKQIADVSGGCFDPKPEELFSIQQNRTVWKVIPLASWLIAMAICLFVFDVLLRRIDVNFRNKFGSL
jgi:uncharacterized membrane protein